MYIKGTEKLKKRTLNLDSIKMEIKAGGKLFIKETDVNLPDIKYGLSVGWLEVVQSDKPAQSTVVGKPANKISVRCKNVSKKPINLPIYKDAIPAGQEFTVEDTKLLDYSLRASIASGIIKVISAVDSNSKTISSTNIRLSSLLPEINKTTINKPEETKNEKENVKFEQTELTEAEKIELQGPKNNILVVNPNNVDPTQSTIKNAYVHKTDKEVIFVDKTAEQNSEVDVEKLEVVAVKTVKPKAAKKTKSKGKPKSKSTIGATIVNNGEIDFVDKS